MTGPRALWILGAGGHGHVVADAAAAGGSWSTIRFFDDRSPDRAGVRPWPLVGHTEDFFAPGEDAERIVAIGDNASRHAASRRCQSLGLSLATVIHPAAVVSAYAAIGPGCFVAAGAVIAFAARLDVACIVNTAASVDHDCELGAAVHIGPGARLGGGVGVGCRAWVGLGAVVRHGLSLGVDAVVGAGAVVVTAVADNAVVMGNPARVRTDRRNA